MFLPSKLFKYFKRSCLFEGKKFSKHKLSESVSSVRLGQKVRDSLQAKMSQGMTKIATGTFTGFVLILAFALNSLYNIQDATAAESITVTISGNPTATVAPSSEGTFADSGDINIGVTSTAKMGYTLSITGGGDANLTGKTDSSKVIQSISSAMDRVTFDTTENNNKWGYKPSMYYDATTEQRAENFNYLPSPSTGGDIIDITKDNSSHDYKMSIGTRVTNTLGLQTYENNTLVLTAVGNPDTCDSSKLCVDYDSNGLTFDGANINHVNYNAPVFSETKYSHTPNVSDAGIASGEYANNLDITDTVTIAGASNLNVTIYYDAESTSYDWVSVYQNPFNISTSNDATVSTSTGNLSGKLSGRNSNRTTDYSTWNFNTYTVTGDTVKFHFKSDSSQTYYGYYAVVSAEYAGERTVYSGSYAVPTGTNATFYGWSTTQVTPGAGTQSDAEYKDESEVLAKMPGENGENKTLYAVWQQGHPITINYDDNVSSVSAINVDRVKSYDRPTGTVTESGQSILLLQGETYVLRPTFASGYTADTIIQIDGEGTLNGNQFTVGSGGATINVTSKQALYSIQNFTDEMCEADASIIPATVYDERDGNGYTVRWINGDCWMTQNLRFNGSTVNPETTNVDSEKTLNWFDSDDSANCGSYEHGYDNLCKHDWEDDYVGIEYNYAGITAGTITGGYNYSEGGQNLCPANWTLPTKTQYQGIEGSSYMTVFSPTGPDRGGDPWANQWWSSTANSPNGRAALLDIPFTIYTNTVSNYESHLARCVRQKTREITVNFASPGISSVAFSASGYPTRTVFDSGDKVSLIPGVQYIVTMNLSSGYATSSWSKDSGSGTLSSTTSNPTNFTVEDGDATLTATAENITGAFIQDFTSEMCQAQASSGNVTVYDKRDGKDYTVRWINGDCWMTQNLRFNGSSINPDTTNIDVEKELEWFDYPNGHCAYDNAYSSSCKKDSGRTDYGTYYNYAGITAGTVTEASEASDDVYNICPKGWTLPSKAQQEGIASYKDEYSPVLSGWWVEGGMLLESTSFWWSSAVNGESAHILVYGGSSLGPSTNGRIYGLSARCILIDKEDITVNFAGSGISSVSFSASGRPTETVSNSGDTVSLFSGIQYTVTANTEPDHWLTDWSNDSSSGVLSSTTDNPTLFTVGSEGSVLTATGGYGLEDVTVNFADSGISSVSFSASGYPTETVSNSGDTVSLLSGIHYTVTADIAMGHIFDSWTKESEAGDLWSTTDNPTTFIVKEGPATLTATSKSLEAIQDFTNEMCQTQASDDNVLVYDVRDGNKYTVRWINGNCWMTQDLRFTGSTLSPETSNVDAEKTLEWGSLYDGNSYDIPRYHDSDGKVWYNYAGVTAGTITGENNTNEDVYNICPKGWTLPTNTQQSGIISYKDAFSPSREGFYRDGSYKNNSAGYGWSSTSSNAYSRYILSYSDGSLSVVNDGTAFGFNARCIRLGEKEDITVNFAGSGISSVSFSASGRPTETVSNSGDTVSLFSGIQYTVTASIESGYGVTGWSKNSDSGDLSSNAGNPIIFTMGNEDTTITVTSQKVEAIQNFTNEMCRTQASEKDVVVYDKRDDKNYTVRWINDDCWMTKDLSFTKSWLGDRWESNIGVGQWPIINWGDLSDGNSSDPRYHYDTYQDRAWYNFSGVSTETYNGVYDLCPAGWTLPNDKQVTGVIDHKDAFSPSTNGFFSDGSRKYGNGYWWSSTSKGYFNRYILKYSNGNLSIDGGNTQFGFSARCVRKKDAIDVKVDFNGSGISSVSFVSSGHDTKTVYNSGDVANIVPGIQYTVVVETTNDYSVIDMSITGHGDLAYYSSGNYDTKLIAGNEGMTLTVSSMINMQSFTKDMCREQATDNYVLVLDKRDRSRYPVQYKGNECWMTDELDFKESTLKPETSNVEQETKIDWKNIASDTDCVGASTDSAAMSTPCISDRTSETNYKRFYNYAGVSAGTIVGESNEIEAVNNVCPAGWTLPTQEQMSSAAGGYFTPLPYGYFLGGSLTNRSHVSLWWTSTSHDSGSRYSMWFSSLGSPLSTTPISRYYGALVRCVRKD